MNKKTTWQIMDQFWISRKALSSSFFMALILSLLMFGCASATINPTTYPKFKAWTTTGTPLSGGKLYTYAPGTTTPKTTYSDSALGTPNANPVVLDSYGEASVYLSTGGYKFVLKTSSGSTLWTLDNVYASPAASTGYGVKIGDYASLTAAITAIGSTPATLIIDQATAVAAGTTFPSTLSVQMVYPGKFTRASTYAMTFNGGFRGHSGQCFTGNGLVTFAAGSVRDVDPLWFGADPTGVTDSTAALQASINTARASGVNVQLSDGVFSFTKLYFYYDASLNPLFPSGDNDEGRIGFFGTGSLNEFDATSSTWGRTTLISTDATGPAIAFNYNGTTKHNNAFEVADITVKASNTTSVMRVDDGADMVYVHDLMLAQAGTGNGLTWEGIWNASLDRVLAFQIGENQTGIGFHLYNDGGDGQLINITRCRARGFGTGFHLGGLDYTGSGYIGSVTMINCGVVLATNGITIGAQVQGATLIDCQVEDKSDDRSTAYGIYAGGTSQRLSVIGGHYQGKTAAIALGVGAGATGDERDIADVLITGTELFLYANNASCVLINNADSGISVGRVRIEGNRFYGNSYSSTYGVFAGKEGTFEVGLNYQTGLTYLLNNETFFTQLKDDTGITRQRISVDGTVTNSISVIYETTAPASGTWRKGDMCFNTAPDAGKAWAWTCTTAGTPGTWVAVYSVYGSPSAGNVVKWNAGGYAEWAAP